MAFPEDAKIFTQANDLEDTDVPIAKLYQQRIDNGDFAGAESLIGNGSGQISPSKRLNAAKFNEVLNEVTAMEEFLNTSDSEYKRFIQNNINAFSDIAQWNSTTSYTGSSTIGNIAYHNGKLYQAIADNTDVEPGVDSGWDSYWKLLVNGQYPVSATQPTNQVPGDIWFQVINNS